MALSEDKLKEITKKILDENQYLAACDKLTNAVKPLTVTFCNEFCKKCWASDEPKDSGARNVWFSNAPSWKGYGSNCASYDGWSVVQSKICWANSYSGNNNSVWNISNPNGSLFGVNSNSLRNKTIWTNASFSKGDLTLWNALIEWLIALIKALQLYKGILAINDKVSLAIADGENDKDSTDKNANTENGNASASNSAEANTTSETTQTLTEDTKPAYIYGVDDAWIADDTQESINEANAQWQDNEESKDYNIFWINSLLSYNECDYIIDPAESAETSNIAESSESESEEGEDLMEGTDAAGNKSDLAVEEEESEEKEIRRMIVNKNSNVIVTLEISLPADDNIADDGQQTSKNLAKDAPLVKFGNYIFNKETINYFEISSEGKIPTIKLSLSAPIKDPNSTNLIKLADVLSVFYQGGHDYITSYKADFSINKIHHSKLDGVMKYDISGELYIPKLYDNSTPESMIGTSKDVMCHMASVLNLNWQWCDNEDTNDLQTWYCTPNTRKNKGNSLYYNYIDNVVKHAYKNKDSYFDWWIDPRYALVFSNMNYMLGEDGEDEDVRMAFQMSNIEGDMSLSKFIPSSKQYHDNPRMIPLILHNVMGDQDMSLTPFFILKNMSKDALSFAYEGTSTEESYTINNNGLTDENNAISFTTAICKNDYKLQHGWRLDLGGATNGNTVTDNYSANHKNRHIAGLINTQSDDDAEKLKKEKSNAHTSGSTHKYYTIAAAHNELNLNYLYHKVIKFELAGNNMQLVKGDKIPVLYVDLALKAISTFGKLDAILLELDLQLCGWFMIKSIKKIYKPEWMNEPAVATSWRTEVELVRREWPIPNYVETEEESSEEATVKVNNNLDNVKEEKWTDSENVTASDYASESLDDIVESGLTRRTLNLFDELLNYASMYGNQITLLSGRRWAADADGKKLSGYASIEENGSYKFINANGEVVWYPELYSKHVDGEAIDVTNGEKTEFSRILSLILADSEMLYLMLIGGYFCAVETGPDDTNNDKEGKHYHIGTPLDTDNDLDLQLKWWTKVVTFKGTTLTYNGKTYEYLKYKEYVQVTSSTGYSLNSDNELEEYDDTPIIVDVTDPIADLETIQTRIMDNNLDDYLDADLTEAKDKVIITYLNGTKGSTTLEEGYVPGVNEFLSGDTLIHCINVIIKDWLPKTEEEIKIEESKQWRIDHDWDNVMNSAYNALKTIISKHSADTYVLVDYADFPLPTLSAKDNENAHKTMLDTITQEYYEISEYKTAYDIYQQWSALYYYDPNNDKIYDQSYVSPVDMDASDIQVSWNGDAAGSATYTGATAGSVSEMAANNVGKGTSSAASNRKVFEECLRQFTSEMGISTLGYYLIFAQVMHESGNFKYFAELGKGSGKDYGKAAGPYSKIYYGRGPVQVTWYSSYNKIYDKFFKTHGLLNYNIVSNPELAESNPAIGSYLTIGWFLNTTNGKKAITAANAGKVKSCTKCINGGYNGLADRQDKTKLIIPSNLASLVKYDA